MFDMKTGRKISAPLKYPRLAPNSIPRLFPGCPSYLSTHCNSRDSPVDKRLQRENEALCKALSESVKEKEIYDKKMNFSTLGELQEKLNLVSYPESWSVIKKQDLVIFSLIVLDSAPFIVTSVLINAELKIKVYFGNTFLSHLGKKCIPKIINNINELSSLIENVNSLWCQSECDENEMRTVHVLHSMMSKLKQYVDEEMKCVIGFLCEQLTLLFCKKESRRYTSDTVIFSALLYSISPHAYKFLMSSKNFIVPHPSTLRRLCSRYQINPKFEQTENIFLNYIKCKFSLLKPCDSNVILMMDEIHMKPFFDYEGGSILGASYNAVNAATTAYVFMLQSIESKYKDVVHILPVSKLTADNLFIFLKKIIIALENIGFRIFVVVSDNNAINGKAMSFFSSPPQMSIVYKHPADASRPLFFSIDSVHLLKCIRNNWLNQKNCGQCFFYPEFITSGGQEKILTSSFLTLKKMYQLESGENSTVLLKYGYGLTMKALNPSNLERQNVSLALKIFNRFVQKGLVEMGKKHNLLDLNSTANFIDIICTWFEIVNVKTPFKGNRLNSKYQEPLTADEIDERRIFLENFLTWLDVWKEKNCSTGMLSKDTHAALTHTTYAILEISRYCFEELKLNYFLPGKIETDKLEERFGKYRRLSGSQYHVSIVHIFESETKLRIQDHLPLIIESSKFGKIEVNNFEEHEDLDEINNNETFKMVFKSLKVTADDLNQIHILPLITYLAGYCIYKWLRKVKCESCRTSLTVDKMLDVDDTYSCIKSMDRGSLLYPHQDIVEAVSYNYIVIKKLLSKESEDLFLKVQNQRSLVADITFQILMEGECLLYDQCSNGHTVEVLLRHVLKASTNTFLKNYCAQKNDNIVTSARSKKRKLETIVKPIAQD